MKRFFAILLTLCLLATTACAYAEGQAATAQWNFNLTALSSELTDMNEADRNALGAMLTLLSASEIAIVWNEHQMSAVTTLSGEELFACKSICSEDETAVHLSIFPSYAIHAGRANAETASEPSKAQMMLSKKRTVETGAFSVDGQTYALHTSLRLSRYECAALIQEALVGLTPEKGQAIQNKLETALSEADGECVVFDLYRNETDGLLTFSLSGAAGTVCTLRATLSAAQSDMVEPNFSNLTSLVLNGDGTSAQLLMDDFVGAGMNGIVNAGIVDYPAETSAFMDWVMNQQGRETDVDFALLTGVAARLTQSVLPILLSSESAPSGMPYVVIGESVNLRRGPGTDFDVVGHVKKGELLQVYGFEGNWARCEKDGERFYIAVKLIEKAE